MAGDTRIEWCDDSLNFQSGCSEARRPDGSMDPACVHCYARLMSARLEAMGQALYTGAAVRSPSGGARWTGALRWDRDLVWRRIEGMRAGKVTFLGSMTDLWHEDADPDMWEALAESVHDRERSRLILEQEPPRGMVTLTKRADRLLLFQRRHFPEGLPVWWWPGVTVSDQIGADLRLPSLLDLHAHGPKVVSYEPAMGPVDWRPWIKGLGWLICGGESGTKARPSHPDWFRAARDAAVENCVAFHFKQWGEWAPADDAAETMVREGKKAAGRVLDGFAWDEVPA